MATDPEEIPKVVEAWHDRRMDVPLVLVEAPFRDLGPPFLEEIRSRTARGDTVVTVVLPGAGAGPLVAEPAPQPVGPVLQADAAVRAGRGGDERPVPPLGARDPRERRRGRGAHRPRGTLAA